MMERDEIAPPPINDDQRGGVAEQDKMDQNGLIWQREEVEPREGATNTPETQSTELSPISESTNGADNVGKGTVPKYEVKTMASTVSPSVETLNPTPEDLAEAKEKFKELYSYSLAAVAERQEMLNRLDQKAAQYLTIVTLLLGVVGLFINSILDNLLPPNGSLATWTTVFAAASIVLLSAILMMVFCTLRIGDNPVRTLNDEFVNLTWERNLLNWEYSIVKGAIEAVKEKNTRCTKKANCLHWSYNLILFTIPILVTFFFLFGAYKYEHPTKKDVKSVAQENRPNDQPTPTPQPTTTPTSGAPPVTNTTAPTPAPVPKATSQPDRDIPATKFQILRDHREDEGKKGSK